MVLYGLWMENMLSFLLTFSVQVKVYSKQLGNYFPIPGYNKLDTGKQMSNTTSVEKVYATFSWSLTVFQYI